VRIIDMEKSLSWFDSRGIAGRRQETVAHDIEQLKVELFGRHLP